MSHAKRILFRTAWGSEHSLNAMCRTFIDGAAWVGIRLFDLIAKALTIGCVLIVALAGLAVHENGDGMARWLPAVGAVIEGYSPTQWMVMLFLAALACEATSITHFFKAPAE